jgi:thiol-disulfide isomerase/thioredoxin
MMKACRRVAARAIVFGLLTLVGCRSSTTAAVSPGPTFIEDDLTTALAQAKTAGKLVFVDAWAPWCHTCLSMQQEVLAQPALAAFADRIVFAAADTDREENAPFLAIHPVTMWPTFFLLDPQSNTPVAVRPGAMSLGQTLSFLETGLSARDPSTAVDPQTKALWAGHQAMQASSLAQAAAAYAEAARLPGRRRTEAILGGFRALSDPSACVAFGLEHLRDVEEGGAAGDIAASLLACARKLPATDERRAVAVSAVVTRWEELAQRPAASSSVDDRADVLAQLATLRQEAGDTQAAAAIHEARLRLLEAAAAQASTPQAARVHDYARMNSYLALGRGDQAVAMLVERTRQLPQSYEAWARLASTLHKLGRQNEAEVAVERAVALAYGTRRLRYLTLHADIAAARHDLAGERAALQRLVDDGNRLPRALAADDLVRAATERLAQLASSAP